MAFCPAGQPCGVVSAFVSLCIRLTDAFECRHALGEGAIWAVLTKEIENTWVLSFACGNLKSGCWKWLTVAKWLCGYFRGAVWIRRTFVLAGLMQLNQQGKHSSCRWLACLLNGYVRYKMVPLHYCTEAPSPDSTPHHVSSCLSASVHPVGGCRGSVRLRLCVWIMHYLGEENGMLTFFLGLLRSPQVKRAALKWSC